MLRIKQVYRCTFFVLLFFAGCTQKGGKEVQRSFYYWKSVFKLSAKEKTAIDNLHVKDLYLKFFDVEWNENSHQPVPVAQIQFSEKSPVSITPVVFITNESRQRAGDQILDTLAKNIINLVASICTNNNVPLTSEVQIDCDWTEKTKEKYFHLLKAIRQQPFLQNKILSATIRLHQLKFISLTGVPPVDKGLLMCYNMGNLRLPQVKNSILDVDEMKKYTGNITDYPLQLDVALPIFDWYVWFQHNEFKGLVHSYYLNDSLGKEGRIIFDRDTTINGLSFREGDWLRYEGSKPSEILQAAKLLNRRIISKKINVILYHLDENNLAKYNFNELENFYSSFH